MKQSPPSEGYSRIADSFGKSNNFQNLSMSHTGHPRRGCVKKGRRLPLLVDEKANASPDAETDLLRHRILSSSVLVPGQFLDPLTATSVSALIQQKKN